MIIRVAAAAILISLAAVATGCSSEPKKAQGESNVASDPTEQSVDRRADLQKMTNGYTSYLAYDAVEGKGFDLTLLTDANQFDRFAKRVFSRSMSLNGSKLYDPLAFAFDKYDYVAVVSKPKSSSAKFTVSKAEQTADGTLRISLQITDPSVQTADMMRELQICRIDKKYRIKKVELQGTETIKSFPTH